MDALTRSQLIKRLATQAGFERCGIAPAAPIARANYLENWLAAGRAGTMDYMSRYTEMRINPAEILEGAQSVIVVSLSYNQTSPTMPPNDSNPSPQGRIAKYAWGDDYHDVLKKKLFAIADELRATLEESFETKVCVDTAPLIERELAAAAGIGWIGKNTLVLNQAQGSFFFLGAIVTTLELAPDEPVSDHCGSCTACLDACPTDAFPAAYEMDASRCISYLTIEHRSDISEELAKQMGDWLFGCDVCQDVCPFNRNVPVTKEPRFQPRPLAPSVDVGEVLEWSVEDYRKHLRGSAIKRAKLDMLQRNATIVRENAQNYRD